MEYKEIAIIVLIILIYFLGRNAIAYDNENHYGNTSEEEKKIAGFLGAAIIFPVIGIFVLALIFGALTSPFFWCFFICYIMYKIYPSIRG